jgi:methyl-accepting chemotaxis protein
MSKQAAAKVRFGIFQQLLITLLAVSVIPLAAVWAVSYRGIVERITESVHVQMELISEALVSYVNDWVEMNYRMLKQNAALADIRSMQAEKQNPILKTIGDEYDWAYLAFTVDPNGQNIGRDDGKPPKYYGDRVYVQQVLRGAPMGQQVLIGKTSKKPAFVLSTPIRGQSRLIRGVIAIAMTIEEMSKQITNTRIGDTGYAFLLDETGKVIAHHNKEYTKTRADLSEHPAFVALKRYGDKSIVYADETGKKVLAHMKRTRHGWIMVTQQDYDEAFAAIAQARTNTLLLLVATVVIVGFIAYLMSRRLSIPIRRLTVIADAISLGELDKKVQGTERRDEIGLLASAIERLRVSMQLAFKRLKNRGA